MKKVTTMSETITFEKADYVRVFDDEDIFEYYDKEVGDITVTLEIEDSEE